MVRNRMFYFGSLEYTRLDTEAIITSPLLQTFEEGAEAHLPSPQRTAQAFARADIRVGSSGSLSPRARVQRESTGNVFLPVDVGIAAPERANDVVSVNSDGGVVHNLVGCDAAERIPRTVCQAQLRSSLTLSWLPCGGTSELQAGKVQCCAEWRD